MDKCDHPDCEREPFGGSINGAKVCAKHIDWAMGMAFAPIHRLEEILKEDDAPVESKIAICADCDEPSETVWEDGTPLCYGCAYGRAGWE